MALAASGGGGFVTAHTRRAELTDLGGAFYANCGTAGRVVERVETRGGLPAVYSARLRCSWVELEAGAELHARLWSGVRELPERTLLERCASRERIRPQWPPAEVAEHPGTVTWPQAPDAIAARRRTAADRRDCHRVHGRAEPRVGGDASTRGSPGRPRPLRPDRGAGGRRRARRSRRRRPVVARTRCAARSAPRVGARERSPARQCCRQRREGSRHRGGGRGAPRCRVPHRPPRRFRRAAQCSATPAALTVLFAV